MELELALLKLGKLLWNCNLLCFGRITLGIALDEACDCSSFVFGTLI
jgi:hypothetical protein